MNKDNSTNIGKIINNSIEEYVPHYTPSIPHQAMLFKQILGMASTEHQYVERFVFIKEVLTHFFWNFELGTQQDKNVPIWIIVGFQKTDRPGSQNLNNNTF